MNEVKTASAAIPDTVADVANNSTAIRRSMVEDFIGVNIVGLCLEASGDKFSQKPLLASLVTLAAGDNPAEHDLIWPDIPNMIGKAAIRKVARDYTPHSNTEVANHA